MVWLFLCVLVCVLLLASNVCPLCGYCVMLYGLLVVLMCVCFCACVYRVCPRLNHVFVCVCDSLRDDAFVVFVVLVCMCLVCAWYVCVFRL